MNRLFVIILTITTTYLSAQDIHSLKLASPVTIDGSPDEWPQPFNFYNGETKLQYRIANDSNNIYVCFKVTDEPAQMKMMRAGINIWLDPKGKKKETMGIAFPLKQEHGSTGDNPQLKSEGHGQIPGQAYQKHDFNRFKAMAKANQVLLKVQGFAGISDQTTGIVNNTGVLASFNWDSLNILCVEYQIPIAAVLQHRLTAADTLKPIGIGFVVNALEAQGNWREGENRSDRGNMDNVDLTGSPGTMNGGMNNGLNNGMNNGMNGGMGGMNHSHEGLGGGEGYGHSGGQYSEIAQERKVWSRLILQCR